MQVEEVSDTFNYMPDTPTTSVSKNSITESLNFTQNQTQPLQSNKANNSNSQQTVIREKLMHAFRLNRKKQLTLERINKYNIKLMEELKTPRVKASNCALMVIDYTEKNEDPLITEIWGNKENNENKFKNGGNLKNFNAYRGNQQNVNGNNGGNLSNSVDQENGTCCVIM